MLLILILLAQWGPDNLENKQIFRVPRRQHVHAESTHNYNVLKYDLDVHLPMTSRSISGVNNISCRSRVDGLVTTTVHAYTLNIDSVMVDGSTATFTPGGDSIVIDLPQTYNTGDSFDIHIGYHGSWSVTSYQSGLCYYPEGYNSSTLHSIAYTLGEPWDARMWMPCYDEPFDKADYGCVIAVTLPDSFVVCANGILIDVTQNPDDTKTYTWEETDPIATYLMHFGASIFSPWSNWYHSPSGDSVEIIHFVWPEDSIQSVSSLSDVLVSMYLMDSLYGSYPFERYGHDVVYPYAWGGMEHQQNTTMHRNVIGGSHGWLRIVAHELAHQWWGDMVTCIDFRDIWLNEGCATYSDANYDWYTMSYSYFQNTMADRAQDYFQADAQWRRPLYDPPSGQMFNWGYTYCKACWVMHMLRFLSPDHFFEGMQAYRDSFEYGCASTDDMNVVFSSVYGEDLTWFFNEWVYDQGYPEYEVYWVCEPAGNDYLTKINVYQTQTNAPPVFHMPVHIMLHTTSNDTIVQIAVTSSPEHAEFTVPDSVTDITFDPEAWILCTHNVYYGIEKLVKDKPVYNDLFFSSNPAQNPFITFVNNQNGNVRLTLLDATGRIIKEICHGTFDSGTYTVQLNEVPAGVYFCHLETSCQERTKKLIIVK